MHLPTEDHASVASAACDVGGRQRTLRTSTRLLRGLLVAALVTITAEPASARVLKDLKWTDHPTVHEFMRYYPEEALKAGVGGTAIIECGVGPDGETRDCKVLRETPTGAGFGEAALKLAPYFRFDPPTENGVLVSDATVRIPIRWTGARNRGPIDFANIPWSEAPTYDQVVAAYPQRAREARKRGFGNLICKIGEDRRLKFCRSAGVSPKGQGFENAANALADLFVAPPSPVDGVNLTDGFVYLPFTFVPEMLNSERMVTGRPKWRSVPDAARARAGYPEAAKRAGVASGKAELTCRIAQGGRMEQCRVTREEPAGLGFGAAALALSSDFAMTIWTDEGFPTVGTDVRIPLRYQLPAEESAATATP